MSQSVLMSKVVLFLDKREYTNDKAKDVALSCGKIIGSLEILNYYIYIVSCSLIDDIQPYSSKAVMLGVPSGMSVFCIYRNIPNSSNRNWLRSVGLGVQLFKKAFDDRFEYVENKNKKVISFFKSLFRISDEEIKQFKDVYFSIEG